MPKLLKRPAAQISKKPAPVGHLATQAKGLQPSALKVFDIPISQLVFHKDNPNEQNERTFDEIVERIRTLGFDTPIHVAPQLSKGRATGKFLIIGGHHRVKAAELVGL